MVLWVFRRFGQGKWSLLVSFKVHGAGGETGCELTLDSITDMSGCWQSVNRATLNFLHVIICDLASVNWSVTRFWVWSQAYLVWNAIWSLTRLINIGHIVFLCLAFLTGKMGRMIVKTRTSESASIPYYLRELEQVISLCFLFKWW